MRENFIARGKPPKHCHGGLLAPRAPFKMGTRQRRDYFPQSFHTISHISGCPPFAQIGASHARRVKRSPHEIHHGPLQPLICRPDGTQQQGPARRSTGEGGTPTHVGQTTPREGTIMLRHVSWVKGFFQKLSFWGALRPPFKPLLVLRHAGTEAHFHDPPSFAGPQWPLVWSNCLAA